MMKTNYKLLTILFFLLVFNGFAYADINTEHTSYYKFDGNTSDELGNFNASTSVGSGGVIGYNSEAFRSDRATNQNIQVTTPGTQQYLNKIDTTYTGCAGNNANCTVGIYIQVTSLGKDYIPVMGNGETNTNYDFLLYLRQSGTLQLYWYNGGQQNQASSSALLSGDEACVVMRKEGNNITVYVNGTSWISKAQDSNTGAELLFAQISDAGDYANSDGYLKFDEGSIWNRSLTEDEITSFCDQNGDYPFSVGTIDTINITNPLPGINSVFNTASVNFNFTLDNAFETNCSLYINNSLNASKTGISSGSGTFINYSVNFNNIDVLDYNYYFNCTDNSSVETSSVVTFSIDTVNPTIVLNPNNFFNSSGGTNTSRFSDLLLANISFADSRDLFGASIIVYDENGVVEFNYTNTSLSGTGFNYVNSINSSVFDVGLKKINVSVADSHTAKSIKDYDVKIKSKGLDFNTAEGNYISITSDYADKITTVKKEDRYSFTFEYPKDWYDWLVPVNKEELVYHIKTRYNSIKYVQDSVYKGHFVVWNAQTRQGNWIDFENPYYSNPVVEKVNDQYYILRFDIGNTDPGVEPKKIEFNSIGGLNVVTQSYEWYKVNKSISYDASITTGSVTEFYFNVTYNSSYTVDVSADFYYNGTKRGVQKTNSSGVLSFFTNISIGEVDGDNDNFNFYWNITETLPDEKSITSQYNFSQAVSELVLSICNSTYNVSGLNFTLFDEETNSRIVADLSVNFDYWIQGNSDLKKTYSFSGTDEINYTFCINPSDANIYSNYTVYYSNGSDYPERRYYAVDALINNAVTQVPLYLLKSSEGIYFRFKTVDQYENSISGVNIVMQTLISGSYVTIEREESDDAGIATFWVDPDTDYRFVFSKSGYEGQTLDLRPTSTEIYTVTMNSDVADVVQAEASGVYYSFSPTNKYLSNQTSYSFSFTLNSSYWEISNLVFNIRNSSLTGDVLATTTPSCSLNYCTGTISFDTDNNTLLISEVVWDQVNGTSNVKYYNVYQVFDPYIGRGSLKNFIDDLSNFSGAGFNTFTKMFLSFVFILFIVILTLNTGLVQNRVEEKVIILIISLVWFFSYIGWLTVSTFLPDYDLIDKYIIFYVMFIIGGGYLINKY